MRRTWVLLLPILLMVGCGGHAPTPEDQAALVSVTPTDTPPPPTDMGFVYRLKPRDRLGVQVLTDPDLSSSVEVQLDGRVAVPWAGTIFAAGRQLSEVEAEIEDSLRNYLRFPDCSLNIDEFGPNLVYIAGEVGLPGSYEINGGQTVLGSIAQAGGFLTTASWQEVVLLRRVSETKATVHRINVERALRGADNFMDPVVQHMDILFVPRTLIADINIFVDQFFRQITPIFTFYLAGWEAFNRQNVETIRVSRFVP